MTRRVDVATLRSWLCDGQEISLLDAREEGVFFNSHLFHASCVPLSRLELMLASLVPRRDTRLVWCDDGSGADGGLAEQAAARATAFGWSNTFFVDGGTRAWAAAGGELYAGVNVPSKAFGEYVEQTYNTPHISAPDLAQRLAAGDSVVVLDSRPFNEFRRMSIPTGIDCPGAELVHRVKEVAPDPATTVVVNCAGRTRSIIGAQSLINAGLPNPVMALENGTMGWHLAGLGVASGVESVVGDPSPEGAAWGIAAAAAVRDRFGVITIDEATLAAWQRDPLRTTYVLDVRSPDEFAAGHRPGSRHAPGGQLVQATDEYVGVRNSRLVLVDDNNVRATMTASWLRQLGWDDAVVLRDGLQGELEATQAVEHALGANSGLGKSDAAVMSVGDLEVIVGHPGVVVVDLATSLDHRRRGHIAGAWWAIRSRLSSGAQLIEATVGSVATVVLTSEDGRLARLAVPEATAAWPTSAVSVLDGGTAAWRTADQPIEFGIPRPTTTIDDVWYKPYDHDDGVPEKHMRAYLTWEVALVEQLARDPMIAFRTEAECQSRASLTAAVAEPGVGQRARTETAGPTIG